MPDLPEIETIKREFARDLVGREIAAVEVKTPSIVNVPLEQFVRRVQGTEFIEVSRRAKYLVAKLSNGFSLVLNLKMSGQFVHSSPGGELNGHVHTIFILDDGTSLFLRDANSFAAIVLLRSTDVTHFFAHLRLGPEPLKPSFDYEIFRLLVKRHPNARIKPLLCDDQFIAGIGSIYSDEILFYARVHPERPATSLTDQEIQRVYEGIKHILPEAINYRGTTTEFYLDLNGEKGEYQDHLKVHAKPGRPCDGCTGSVERIEVAGRDTYICPSCQH